MPREQRQAILPFLSVPIIVISILNFLTSMFFSKSILNIKEIIKDYGTLFFSYTWIILPIFISILILLLKGYLIEEFNVKSKVQRYAAIWILTTSFLIFCGYFSYNDSRKTNVTIISENPIYRIKFESRNRAKNIFDLIPYVETNNYYLNKRLPFVDYNITVTFRSEQIQFITRTFNQRKETLVLFR